MDFKELKNKYKGKKAVVIGSGSSLRHVKPDQVYKSDVITIAVNAAILWQPKISPHFWLTDDKHVRAWSYYQDVLNSEAIKVVNNRFITDEEKQRKDFVGYDSRVAMDIQDDGKLITGKSSISTAIAFAKYLGCEQVILLGCDCCLEDNKRYFWEFPYYPKPVCKKMITEKVRISENMDNVSCSQQAFWDKFAEANPDLNIVNCSQNTVITAFQIANIEDVLR